MINANSLLEPFKLNETITLKNRIIMAPMTRNKATDDLLSPTPAMASYYAKRAEAGLIITEGTIIRPDGRGYSNTPGIYTDEQIKGWQKVTHAVHNNNGRIFLQIWHVGRVSHPIFLNGSLPVSPSETHMSGPVRRADNLYYGKSRALSKEEIKELVNSYARAANNALKAGFDGIEIHGANGYLIDQFLHYSTNKRQDEYGITPENLARFALEVVDACIKEIGRERVGLRLSPGAYLNEIVGDKRDAAVFQYLLAQLTEKEIAYLHTGNFDDEARFLELDNRTMTEFMRNYFRGNLIASGGYTVQKAAEAILANKFDLIAFGRPFIANPDFIERVKSATNIQSYDASMLETLA